MRAAILAVLCAASIAALWLYVVPRDATQADEPELPVAAEQGSEPLLPRIPRTEMTTSNVRPEPEPLPAAPIEPRPLSPNPEWARGLNFTQDEIDWMRVSFTERERIVREEARDLDWAPAMERAIAEMVAGFVAPSMQLLSADCRTTVCRIAMYQEGEVYLDQLPFSRFRDLGLDLQGPMSAIDEGNHSLHVMIVRRR